MKFTEFKYLKPGDTTPTQRKLIQFTEDSDSLAGLDLTHLSPAEQKELLGAFDIFQAVASKYMSAAYRNFKKSNIVK